MRTNFRPMTEEENQVSNYAVATRLHKLVAVYKGFSEDRFLNYLNTKTYQNDAKVESIRESCDQHGNMQFVVFFVNDENPYCYSFSSSRVVIWLEDYLDKCLVKMEWK